MDFNGIEPISQEERESLMMNNISSYYGGGGIATVKVVEYMVSSMSKELLCKFPDNSAFDFDYTQSSIWSPLVPHPSNPSSPVPDLQRKLSYDDEEHRVNGRGCGCGGGDTAKKFTENVKNKITDTCVFSCFKMHHKFSHKKMMMKKRRSFRGFDQVGLNSSKVVADPACFCSSPVQSKGWRKVLKAASKQFKKTMKHRDSGVHLKLSNGVSHYYSY